MCVYCICDVVYIIYVCMSWNHTYINASMYIYIYILCACTVYVTLWLFNVAMENGLFIDDFPSYKPPSMEIFHGYVK